MQYAIDVAHLHQRPRAWRRSIKIGDASFFGLGVPMLSGIAAFTERELIPLEDECEANDGLTPESWARAKQATLVACLALATSGRS